MKILTLSGKNKHLQFIIDDIDYLKIASIKWYLHSSGYIKSSKGYIHHLIIGKPSKGYEVDHINRNKFDNRKENLRFLTIAENRKNKGKYKRTPSISGKYKYAYWNCTKTRFQSRIRINNKSIYLGTYNTAYQANKKAVQYLQLMGSQLPNYTA